MSHFDLSEISSHLASGNATVRRWYITPPVCLYHHPFTKVGGCKNLGQLIRPFADRPKSQSLVVNKPRPAMTDPNFFVETPRLFLSYLLAENDEHCDFLVTLYNTPLFLKSIGGQPTSIVTRDAARKTLAGRFREEHARNGYGTYLVSLKPPGSGSGSGSGAAAAHADDDDVPLEGTVTVTGTASGKESKLAVFRQSTPIGTVGLLKGIKPDCYEAPDIGFVILPEYARQGYTKEAASGILNYLEREKGLKEVFGFCNPTNEASQAVFKSLGFKRHGDRPLRVFGGEMSTVWTKPGMAEDLAVYGIE